MSLSYIYSLVFFVSFAVYIILGIYVLSLNSKTLLNRLFFSACISLSIWAFCFSIANSAKDYETALLWRRLASLGWGTVYSLLLHFFLVKTDRKKILKNKWIYALLYVPAMVNVFAFGFFDFARGQYKLVYTASGWINASSNTWGDLYFNLYYVGFTLTGLWLLWSWGRKSKDQVMKKQAYLLMIAYTVAIIVGSLTDNIVNNYTSFKVPQIGPVIVLLPTAAIFYAIKMYGLMSPENGDRVEPGKILSEVNIRKVIQIMSLVYVIGGMLNFAAQYFFYQTHPNLNSVLLLTLFFFVVGIALQIIQRIPIRDDYRETVLIFLLLGSILVITMSFIETASITVWAAPFIIVMLSVVFNKRRLIFWMWILIIATQTYIWVKMPAEKVQVDGSDYLVRIGIFSITLCLAFFVNRVYIKRLEENEAQIRFQKMVARISANFVKVTESNLDEKINELLELSGKNFQADLTLFIRLSEDQEAYEWCNEGIESAIGTIPKLTDEAFPWWVNEIISTDFVNISDVETLPAEAQNEKEILKYHNIKSVISLTVKNKGKIEGFLFFASVKEVMDLEKNHPELLRILANLLSDALVKVEAEKVMTYMAYYDALTGLPNQTLFKNKLEQAINSTWGTEKLVGVLFIDLDFFKSVNDTIGHLGGDEMLKKLAGRLSDCLRENDTVSRFGGDEFTIALTEIDRIEDIRKIADNIIDSITQPMIVRAQEFFITASIGIAIYPADGENAEDLVKNADLAMYDSKAKGKNQYTLCSSAMKEEMLRITLLTNSLYRALERNELVLYYQPQVNVITKEVVGLEALIRWNHPDLGMISPGTFIPLAEQTGLINPIGEWILETACRQNKEWQALGLPDIRMAVNLSVVQLKNTNIVSIVDRILNETGLEPKYLELEITESAAENGTDDIITVLNQLRELGVSISIDDFGTEYSSLSRLATLPFDRIKIDMQFVRGISKGNKDKAIAKTIIQLAKNLNLHVIAEGVETESQFEFFDKYKCDEIQGYYFYKPMPATEIEPVLMRV